MTKPVIVTRAIKGAPLTRTELDGNFTNLDNASWSVSDGTNSKAFSLNDTLQFIAGTNISVGVDNTTGAVTITNTATGGTGTVTSVAGTGTVNGLTLTGSITTAGSLTLGGTLNLSSPPAIGSTTASTGAFTTLSASGTVSGTGFTNRFASPGPIGSTTASTGTFTQLYANSTVNMSGANAALTFNPTGTGTVQIMPAGSLTLGSVGVGITINGVIGGTAISNYLASPPAIGSTTASTGAFTTLSTSGAVTSTVTTTGNAANITYNPTTTTGSAIQTTGKNTQGGSGYFDFFKATNSSTGASNINKTIRLNSTGVLEIINSAYTTTLLSLTDAGALTVGGTTLPSATGTTGQVLSLSAAGTAAWSTPSSGGNSMVVLTTPNMSFSASSPMNESWQLRSTGGISGVSVSTNTITLPAGSYVMLTPVAKNNTTGGCEIAIFNNSDSVNIGVIAPLNWTDGAGTNIGHLSSNAYYFTLASAKTILLKANSASAGNYAPWSSSSTNSLLSFIIHKVA